MCAKILKSGWGKPLRKRSITVLFFAVFMAWWDRGKDVFRSPSRPLHLMGGNRQSWTWNMKWHGITEVLIRWCVVTSPAAANCCLPPKLQSTINCGPRISVRQVRTPYEDPVMRLSIFGTNKQIGNGSYMIGNLEIGWNSLNSRKISSLLLSNGSLFWFQKFYSTSDWSPQEWLISKSW